MNMLFLQEHELDDIKLTFYSFVHRKQLWVSANDFVKPLGIEKPALFVYKNIKDDKRK